MEKRGKLLMFNDVKQGKWYFDYVNQAVQLGLMKGINEKTFMPEKGLTRAEAATVAVRLYEATNTSFVKIIKPILKAVLTVFNTELSGGQGSGVFVSNQGFFLTNKHVLGKKGKDGVMEYPKTCSIRMSSGRRLPATVVSVSGTYDLALCKVTRKDIQFPLLKMRFESLPPAVGSAVVAVGSPHGLFATVTDGIVSRHARVMGHEVIQTDAEINPGNSGGALVNLKGQLVGIPTWIARDTEGIAFAISMDNVRDFLVKNNPTVKHNLTS